MTSVKDQKYCGSCVSFCCTAVVESMASIEHGQLLDLSEDSCERGLHIGDGALGKIGSLLLEAAMVLDEFLPVKLCERVLRADRPRIGHEAWHAGSSE